MHVIAKMLHISDLHFSENLTEEGRRIHKKVISPGLKTHEFRKIDNLSFNVSKFEAEGKGVDIFAVTGDVSTNGLLPALNTAREFIETSGGIYKGTPRRLKTEGLGADPGKRLIVPGNHDRYNYNGSFLPYQQPIDSLEKAFEIEQLYPYVIGYRQPDLREKAEQPALIFFVFDSTLTDLDGGFSIEKIARGHIEPAQCRWLKKESEKIAKYNKVPSLDGQLLKVNYNDSIRIVVLHHHPVKTGKTSFISKYSMLKNNDIFIEACFDAGIDFILFGHQHFQYSDRIPPPKPRPGWNPPSNAHDICCFCCPSTSEFKKKTKDKKKHNGFYFFTFKDQKFVVEAYTWNDKLKGFSPVPEYWDDKRKDFFPKYKEVEYPRKSIGSAQI